VEADSQSCPRGSLPDPGAALEATPSEGPLRPSLVP